MELRELLAGADVVEIDGDAGDRDLRPRLRQPRRSGPGRCSSASPASRADGHEFAPLAVAGGAAAVVVERALELEPCVVQAVVGDARAAMAHAAVALLRRPDRRAAGRRDHRHERQDDDRVPGPPHPRARRRPDRPAGDREAGRRRRRRGRSSARPRRRSTCRRPSGGWSTPATAPARWRSPRTRSASTAPTGSASRSRAFTNLTQDHLDFHADMEDYFLAKRRLFDGRARRARGRSTSTTPTATSSPPSSTRSPSRPPATSAPTCARSTSRFDASGSRFRCVGPGRRGRGRAAAARAASTSRTRSARSPARRALGVGLGDAAAALADAERVPGRFEPVDEGQPFAVLVDYAHTPTRSRTCSSSARQITAPTGG